MSSHGGHDELAQLVREVTGAPPLAGQTVVVIGGGSGIGFETARRARGEGAEVIITARDPDRVVRAGLELGASIAAFDATDFDRLARFFDALPAPIDHVLLAGSGPFDTARACDDADEARHDIVAHLLLPLQVARNAARKVHPEGSLLFMDGTAGRLTARDPALASALTVAGPAMTRTLALELAPIRVNLIAAGRADVADLAVHLMTSRAVTGATIDIDGAA